MAKTLEEILDEEKPEVVLGAFRRANEMLGELERKILQQAEGFQAPDSRSHQD
jgi:hypothetical protein